MYYIVETKEQLETLKQTIDSECFINIIPYSDLYHPILSGVSLVYYKPIHQKGYIICVYHSEALKISFSDILELFKKYKTIKVLDSKFHLYYLDNFDLIDINFELINRGLKPINETEYNTTEHNIIYNKYPESANCNRIISISKHYEKWENIYNNIKEVIKTATVSSLTPRIFFNIEKNGIKIDSKEFFKYYDPHCVNFSIKNDKIFTYYNLYNATRRPTNSFNSINFSALPKNTRKSFIPENDLFIEIDYKEYHPRIIAKLTNYPLNYDQSIYELVANNQSISLEEAKKLTFKHLYGSADKVDLDYFHYLELYKDKMLEEYNKNGYILIGEDKIYVDNPNKSKILNYIIQYTETYNNITTLHKLFKTNLLNNQTKLVHYTYDSFLLDVSKNETKQLEEIIKILSEHFPIKITYGKNYRDMEKFNIYTI